MNRSTKILCCIGAGMLFNGATQNVQAGKVHARGKYSVAQREVLDAVDALFVAMGRHDVAASRKLIIPGAGFMVINADGTSVMERDIDYLDSLAKHKEVFHERIWKPQVTVQGNIAQVWAAYDFHLDDKFSHCGIDSFSMVRSADGWRIASVSYTVQKQGCAP
ncbi:MAG: nuclear transport factor 2 family protein, partial [Rhodanobacter sp.]